MKGWQQALIAVAAVLWPIVWCIVGYFIGRAIGRRDPR
jgi:membrane protein DedA with SNARE-associated domain